MPEYLAPGVYVEEVSFRSKSIEGVSTTTTGFVGPTRFGPIGLEPEVITSLNEYERTYGDGQQLQFNNVGERHNYMWHAVRAFFEEGGKRLYVARIYGPTDAGDEYRPGTAAGCATATLPEGAGANRAFTVRARFPGRAGNMRVRLTVNLSPSVLSVTRLPGTTQEIRTFSSLQDRDIVWVSDILSPVMSPPGSGSLYLARHSANPSRADNPWDFFGPTLTPPESPPRLDTTSLSVDPEADRSDEVRIVTLTVTVIPADPNSPEQVWANIAPDPNHIRFGVRDSLTDTFAEELGNPAQERNIPIVISRSDGTELNNGLDVLEALFTANPNLRTVLLNPEASQAERTIELLLEDGSDGNLPGNAEYEGDTSNDDRYKTGLVALEDVEDISIVAAPGATFNYDNANYNSVAMEIVNNLIRHAQRMRYRIAVIDSGDNQSISQVRNMRYKLDSTYGALYYPWIRIQDPITRRPINVPPSGFVAGIYARNDVLRAVYKAPANEVVNLAIGFERLVNKGQQEVLNPDGVNCLRFFEGRGFRIWGARTVSSDPEWKYVNLRRYFAYLERSIDRGTQWAVFEPNGDLLWANVRRTIEDFLLNEWQMGALLGDKPDKAFFVKCDRSTMTQNDLDNGRLVCLIGVAALRPAEFVIFRIGQWTGDRKP